MNYKIKTSFRSIKVSETYKAYITHQGTNNDNSTEYLIMYNDLATILKKEMLMLPDSQRKALYMRKIDGLSRKEIATKLNCKENNVRVLINRALKKLKQRLEIFPLIFLI